MTPLRHLAVRLGHLHGAAIVVDADEGQAVAMAAADLEAVVTHLVDNAIAAAGRSRPVVIRVASAARRVLVDVIDEGPGMTPEFMRDQLFRPWHSDKPGGSGVGAFQARALLRAAGGDLLVTSAPGAGTTMRLLLPAAAATHA